MSFYASTIQTSQPEHQGERLGENITNTNMLETKAKSVTVTTALSQSAAISTKNK